MPIRIEKRHKIGFKAVYFFELFQAQPIGVPHRKQERTRWCWAACTQMVLHFYGQPQMTQWDIAGKMSPHRGECTNGVAQGCNCPCSTEAIQALYEKLGIHVQRMPHQVAFDSVKNELAEMRPLEVIFSYGPDSQHAVLVVGTVTMEGRKIVRVNDPAFPNPRSAADFEDLRDAFGAGTWESTFLGFERQ